MKRSMSMLITILFILNIITLSGCSSDGSGRYPNRQREGIPSDSERQFQANRSMNLTEEERQQMIESRQQSATEACQGKNEGDSCQLEGREAEMNGICGAMDEVLVCIPERPAGQRRG